MLGACRLYLEMNLLHVEAAASAGEPGAWHHAVEVFLHMERKITLPHLGWEGWLVVPLHRNGNGVARDGDHLNLVAFIEDLRLIKVLHGHLPPLLLRLANVLEI